MIALIVGFLFIGLTSATPISRIVNGTDADVGEFPYIVSLRSRSNNHNCGASILSKNFVLTAAHCVQGHTPSTLSIQYGVVEISADTTNSIQVESLVYHDNYAPADGYRNDIAVLKLSSDLPLSDTVKQITLPKLEQNFEGWSSAILVGWGLPQTGGSVMTHLQKVEILLFPQEQCKAAHGTKVDDINHVCAGLPEGGKGQCNGDSGGPLTVDGVQVGIVSWSVKPCTIAGYPGVFTRVAHHIDWIKDNMAKL
ncbi:chymotrypsin-1-like [Onthophagus taurus]|uniref:chymotrypsin-1-like n=1 Tax=Onthophagus taurus TaxID=166361 RepID=UPI0039BE89AA